LRQPVVGGHQCRRHVSCGAHAVEPRRHVGSDSDSDREHAVERDVAEVVEPTAEGGSAAGEAGQLAVDTVGEKTEAKKDDRADDLVAKEQRCRGHSHEQAEPCHRIG